MSESIFNRDRRIRASSLPMGPKFLLVTLNNFIGNNGHAWPSVETLAKSMSVTTRSARNWMSDMVALGVLVVVPGGGRSQTNRYEMRLDMLPGNSDPGEVLNSERHSVFMVPGLSETLNVVPLNPERGSINPEPRSPRKDKKGQLKEHAFLFPENLRTPDFEIAWHEWTKHRREIRKTLTPSTIGKQLRQLASWGPAKAVAAIETSIAAGWTGLFDPDGKRGSGGTAADPAAESAWAAVLEAIRRHSRYEPDKIRAELDERSWQAAKAVGLKKLDEASDFERRELKSRFMNEFQKRQGAAA